MSAVSEPGGVEVFDLDAQWERSTGDPRGLVSLSDPELETGTYVIRPGERVPEAGTTSHEGTEISVVHEGTVALVAGGETREVGPGTLTVIPAGLDHYSENRSGEPVRLVYTVVGGL